MPKKCCSDAPDVCLSLLGLAYVVGLFIAAYYTAYPIADAITGYHSFVIQNNTVIDSKIIQVIEVSSDDGDYYDYDMAVRPLQRMDTSGLEYIPKVASASSCESCEDTSNETCYFQVVFGLRVMDKDSPYYGSVIAATTSGLTSHQNSLDQLKKHNKGDKMIVAYNHNAGLVKMSMQVQSCARVYAVTGSTESEVRSSYSNVEYVGTEFLIGAGVVIFGFLYIILTVLLVVCGININDKFECSKHSKYQTL